MARYVGPPGNVCASSEYFAVFAFNENKCRFIVTKIVELLYEAHCWFGLAGVVPHKHKPHLHSHYFHYFVKYLILKRLTLQNLTLIKPFQLYNIQIAFFYDFMARFKSGGIAIYAD